MLKHSSTISHHQSLLYALHSISISILSHLSHWIHTQVMLVLWLYFWFYFLHSHTHSLPAHRYHQLSKQRTHSSHFYSPNSGLILKDNDCHSLTISTTSSTVLHCKPISHDQITHGLFKHSSGNRRTRTEPKNQTSSHTPTLAFIISIQTPSCPRWLSHTYITSVNIFKEEVA